MIQGDEWVRALFRKEKVENSIKCRNDILSHLKSVEKDFCLLEIFQSKLKNSEDLKKFSRKYSWIMSLRNKHLFSNTNIFFSPIRFHSNYCVS